MLSKSISFFLLLPVLISAPSFGADLCRHAYILTAEDRVSISTYNEYLVSTDDGLVGFYLDGNTFKLRNFSSLADAEAFYGKIPNLNTHLLSDMIRDNKILSKIIELNKFLPALSKLAIDENGTVSIRVKTLESLKEKIISRIASTNKVDEKYTLKEVADTLGARLVVPFSSPILKFTSHATAKQEWAQALKIPESWINEVEIKGSEKDVSKEKYYSAIHLTIRGSHGEILELQVMSEAMATWHKWDHASVYKANLSASEKRSLKPYSRDWAKLLHGLSTLSSRAERRIALHDYANQLGIPLSENLSLIGNIDQALRIRHSVPLKKGFSPSDLEMLAKAMH